jgi:homoserine O-acetyltransferase
MSLRHVSYFCNKQKPLVSRFCSIVTRTTEKKVAKTLHIVTAKRHTSIMDMKDDYGEMDSSGKTFIAIDFVLESGHILPEAHARYNTFGELNEAKDNLLVVCHALTGNSRLDQWWGDMLGPGKPFDTSKYMVVCANVLGSCYGSTGPMSIDPSTNKVYGNTFPEVSIRDSVRLHMLMTRNGIGATKVTSVIGGSMGGMQALEWAILGGTDGYVRSAVSIGCGAAHTAWQIAISETQRQAIYADPKWKDGDVDMNDLPLAGLAVARQIAMVTYRTAKGYDSKFGREKDGKGQYQARKYLEYQGKKFISRFDPVSYVKITEQMDEHNVGHNRGGIAAALGGIKCPYMVIGMDSDLLYPVSEQEELVAGIPDCEYHVLVTPDGHDGFLLEQDLVGVYITDFLAKNLEKISK